MVSDGFQDRLLPICLSAYLPICLSAYLEQNMWNRFLVMIVVVSAIAAYGSLALPADGGSSGFSGCAYKLTPLPPQNQRCRSFPAFIQTCPDCGPTTEEEVQDFTEYSQRQQTVPEPGYDSAGAIVMPCLRTVSCTENVKQDFDCTRVGGELSTTRACTPTSENRYCRAWISTPQQQWNVYNYELWPCIAGM